MSVETELADLREDFRAMRAAFDSFTKTIQGDIMSRLGAVEQWQFLANEERPKIAALEQKMAGAMIRAADVQALQSMQQAQALEIKNLTSINDQMQGAFKTLRNVGGFAIAVLTVAEIIHGFFTIKGH